MSQINEASSEEDSEMEEEEIYYPEIYLEKISESGVQRLPDVVVAEDWIFKFETNDFCYFKSTLTYQLDECYGDIGGQIVDIEQEILREVENQVRHFFGNFHLFFPHTGDITIKSTS